MLIVSVDGDSVMSPLRSRGDQFYYDVGDAVGGVRPREA
jgi:hypothetical protein